MTMRDSSSSMACTDCMACSLSGVARLRRSATLAALSCVFLLLCGVPGEGKKDLTKTLRGLTVRLGQTFALVTPVVHFLPFPGLAAGLSPALG